jgi:hypothetical protein
MMDPNQPAGGMTVTWNVVKWIAIVSMFIDHTAAVLITYSPPLIFGLGLYDIMRLVGRMAFPIFAYGIAQGCVYTHSARRYLGRLFLFAVISELPYQLALNQPIPPHFDTTNVFFTLFAGAACCEIVKFCKSKHRGWVAVFPVVAIVLLCDMRGTDYGGFGVLFVLMPYLFFENKTARLIALGSITAFFYIVVANFSGFSSPLWWVGNSSQFWYMVQQTVFALLGVGLVALCNGQPGSRKGKWFFYIFYPAHLTVLFLVDYALYGPTFLSWSQLLGG